MVMKMCVCQKFKLAQNVLLLLLALVYYQMGLESPIQITINYSNRFILFGYGVFFRKKSTWYQIWTFLLLFVYSAKYL